jgi:hypothetical protein
MVRMKFVPFSALKKDNVRRELISKAFKIHSHKARVRVLEGKLKRALLENKLSCRKRTEVEHQLHHRRNKLVSVGRGMASALRNGPMRRPAAFLQLFNPENNPIPPLSMGRAAWIATDNGRKHLKLLTKKKYDYCKQRACRGGIVRLWGCKEGFGWLGNMVWQGDDLLQVLDLGLSEVEAEGPSDSLLDAEEYDDWCTLNVHDSCVSERWKRYCSEKLKLTQGPFVVADFSLLWPPQGGNEITSMRDLL